MKAKKSEILTVLLFCGFLFGMLLCYLVLPKTDFSATEKRYLAERKKATWASVSSGEWESSLEDYLADHMPARNFFVGLNAYFDLYTGRQVSRDIRVEGDRLLERPAVPDDDAIQKNMTAICAFADALGQNVDLAVIPSAGWAMGLKDYQDKEIIETIYASVGETVTVVDMTSVFEGNPQWYYKTDHHWTSEGAYEAYAAYMERIGREYRAKDDFEKAVYGGFRGSTYSRSALWLTPAETLELWQGNGNLEVTNGESGQVHVGVFYPQRLREADKYTVFLDGNHSIVRIRNPEKSGKLLVIRDSYSNCLGCFLAESYGEVVLADLRYYKQPVSELVRQEGFDNILVCYSIGNFLTDGNLVWLR